MFQSTNMDSKLVFLEMVLFPFPLFDIGGQRLVNIVCDVSIDR